MSAAAVPRLMAITDLAGLERPFGDWLEELVAAGVDALQLRAKHLGDRDLYELARDAAQRAAGRVTVLVNGRADVAVAAGCQGVHLPADALPAAVLRRRFPHLLIGRSTHRPGEVTRARDDGADYVTFGPVWPTPSKARYGPPPGLDGLRRAARCGVPVLALGGVTPEGLAAAAEAGASGAAAIRALQRPSSLVEMGRRARLAWPGTDRADAGGGRRESS